MYKIIDKEIGDLIMVVKRAGTPMPSKKFYSIDLLYSLNKKLVERILSVIRFTLSDVTLNKNQSRFPLLFGEFIDAVKNGTDELNKQKSINIKSMVEKNVYYALLSYVVDDMDIKVFKRKDKSVMFLGLVANGFTYNLFGERTTVSPQKINRLGYYEVSLKNNVNINELLNVTSKKTNNESLILISNYIGKTIAPKIRVNNLLLEFDSVLNKLINQNNVVNMPTPNKSLINS